MIKNVEQAGAELCQAQLRFEVWGLVKALGLIFENNNVEEVWIQRNLKLKKLLNEKVLDDEVWSWRNFKLMKFENEELWSWSGLELEKLKTQD